MHGAGSSRGENIVVGVSQRFQGLWRWMGVGGTGAGAGGVRQQLG